MRFHHHAPVAILVVVVSVLFLGSAAAVALPRKLSQPEDLILKLCNKTQYVDLCIKSVTENIKGTPTGISILDAEIDASIKCVNWALAQVENLQKNASKQEKAILSTCSEVYGLAMDHLKDAKTSIKASDLNDHLSASMTYVSNCESSYEEFSIPSPLTEVDELLDKLGSNSLDIANEIVF